MPIALLLSGLLVAALDLSPPGTLRSHRPRGPVLATLLREGIGTHQPRPFVCGLFRPSLSGRPDTLRWWRDAEGVAVPVVIHRLRGRSLVHGVHPGAGRAGTRLMAGGRPGSWPKLRLVRDAEGIVVEGVSAPLRFGGGGAVAFHGVRLQPLPGFAGSPDWEVVHHCPLRIDLRVAGRLRNDLAGVDAELVMTVHAGVPRIDASLHLRSFSPCRLPADFGLEARVRALESVMVGGHLLPPSGQAHRRQGRWWLGRTPLGQAPGCSLVGDRGRLHLLPASGPRPGFVRISRRGGDTIRLRWEAGARLDRGEGRVLRMHLAAGASVETNPLLLVPTRPITRLHGRVQHVAPVSEEDPLERVARDLIDGFLEGSSGGLIHEGPEAGDWRMSREDVGNLEFDTSHGLMRHAARHHHQAAFVAARCAMDHLLGFDRDAASTGLFHPHGPGHRAVVTEPGHHWIDGLVLLEAWTGDPLLTRALDRILEDQLEHFARRRLERSRPRSLGWGLRALCWARRARDPRPYLAELKRWRRHIASRVTREGLLRLARSGADADFVAASPMIQGGIVLPALVASLDLAPDAGTRRLVRGLSRALARHAVGKAGDGRPYLVEALHLAGRRFEVVGRSGVASGEGIALFLAGLASADRAVLKRPALRALRATIPSRLLAPQQRYVGRELSLLLAALPELAPP